MEFNLEALLWYALGSRLLLCFYRYLVLEGLVRLRRSRDCQAFSGNQRLEHRLSRTHFVVGFRSSEGGNLALVVFKKSYITNLFLSKFGLTLSCVLYLV